MSMELLCVVFGLQNKLQKAEHELDSMKSDTDAKFAKIDLEYLAVRDYICHLVTELVNEKNCISDSEKNHKIGAERDSK